MLLPANYDIFIERGIAFGPLVITVYDDTPPLEATGTPTVTPVGTAGTTAYSYKIVPRNASTGSFGAASTSGSTATGNATLTSTNYNRIVWTEVTNATIYDVYRTASSGSPASTGYLGSTAGLTFNDTGLTGDSTTPPATGGPGAVVNLTGFTAHAQARRDAPDTVLQDLAPVITSAAGGVIQIGKFTDEQTLTFKLAKKGAWSLVLENSSGDWLPAIVAGSYNVTDSVTRNQS